MTHMTNNYRPILCVLCAVLSLAAIRADAQHLDILVQDVGGKLTTGAPDLDGGGFSMGTRVYTSQFPSSFVENNPGWNAIASGSASMPPGANALPGSTDLDWDFLPMAAQDLTSNLLYWDGVGGTQEEVSFGEAPDGDYSLSFFGKDGESAAADGTDDFVPGHTIDTTAANGFLHKHRVFFLDDGDENVGTPPASGIYLIALQVRMFGLDASDPFYLLWATPGVSLSTLDGLARPWVESRVDQLVCDGSPGDFDCDGDVDGDDFLAWQTGSGITSNALRTDGDADADGDVDDDDFLVWQSGFGSSNDPPVLAVPEPAAVATLYVMAAVGVFLCRGGFSRLPNKDGASSAK